MSSGIYSALSGAIAQERSLEVVANNVANAGTTAYRADRVSFQEVLSPNAGENPEAIEPSRYVAIDQLTTDDSPGSLRQTGNPLDVAIQGDGLFVVNTPAGERYTRAGAFLTDGEGQLMTPAGHPVQDISGGEIMIPTDAAEIQIGSDGVISADGNEVGQLRVVQFAAGQVVKEGLTLFVSQNGVRPTDATEASIVQHHLETSNINAVSGMTQLITVSRSFDTLQKVIDTFKQIDDRAAREIARR